MDGACNRTTRDYLDKTNVQTCVPTPVLASVRKCTARIFIHNNSEERAPKTHPKLAKSENCGAQK
jgi:hypothetical protein